MRSQLDSGRRSGGGPLRPVIVVAVVVVIALAALAWFRTGEPRATIEADRPGIGRAGTAVTVHLAEPSRGLAGARVELVQEGKATVLDERSYPGPRPFWAFWGPRATEDTFEVTVDPETVDGLREGDATVRVVAERAGSPIRSPGPVTEDLALPVDLRPPLVTVLSRQHYVAQGGSGVVVYRVDASALADGGRDGVRVTLPPRGAGETASRTGPRRTSASSPATPCPAARTASASPCSPRPTTCRNPPACGWSRPTPWATRPRSPSSTSGSRGRRTPTRSG